MFSEINDIFNASFEAWDNLMAMPVVGSVIRWLLLFVSLFSICKIFSYIFDCFSSYGKSSLKKLENEIDKLEEDKSFVSLYMDALDEVLEEHNSEVVVKMQPAADSRDIPNRCPYCWGIPDNDVKCQFCGSRF